MRVGLFVTCLVDLMRPSVGFAAVKLLEAAGCTVVVPEHQTCCGQPAWNSGDRATTLALVEKMLNEFERCDYIVAPSGSCSGMIRHHYADVCKDDLLLAERVKDLSEKTWELTDFLVTKCKLDKVPGEFKGTVTYHDSCSGLREMGVKQQPRALLKKIEGLTIKESPACEECCGFGGAFSVKFGEISAAIAERKCESIKATGANTVVLGDLGCMLNIAGKLSRMNEPTRVLHVAEVLAGVDDGN